jgi:hypothetical protein
MTAAQKHLSAQGILLAREETPGGYERLHLLAAGQGPLKLMRRPSSKPGATILPDLFDLASVELESRQGGAWFVREYTLLRRHTGIGASYPALSAAARWSALVLANAPHMEDCDSLYDISLKLLDALERGGHPEAMLLKSLFLFARSEGLPVSEDWYQNLGPEMKAAAAGALNRPASEGLPETVAEAVPALADSLTRWMTGEHHIVAPAARG